MRAMVYRGPGLVRVEEKAIPVCCGSCFFCSRGLYSNCHNVNPNPSAIGGICGYSHSCGGYDGGQAEYVRVPFADVGPTQIPA